MEVKVSTFYIYRRYENGFRYHVSNCSDRIILTVLMKNKKTTCKNILTKIQDDRLILKELI